MIFSSSNCKNHLIIMYNCKNHLININLITISWDKWVSLSARRRWSDKTIARVFNNSFFVNYLECPGRFSFESKFILSKLNAKAQGYDQLSNFLRRRGNKRLEQMNEMLRRLIKPYLEWRVESTLTQSLLCM
jgi:hypothetical protein